MKAHEAISCRLVIVEKVITLQLPPPRRTSWLRLQLTQITFHSCIFTESRGVHSPHYYWWRGSHTASLLFLLLWAQLLVVSKNVLVGWWSGRHVLTRPRPVLGALFLCSAYLCKTVFRSFLHLCRIQGLLAFINNKQKYWPESWFVSSGGRAGAALVNDGRNRLRAAEAKFHNVGELSIRILHWYMVGHD